MKELTDDQVEWIRNEILMYFIRSKPIKNTKHCSFDVVTYQGKVTLTFDAISIFGYKTLAHAYAFFHKDNKGVHINMTYKQANSIARTITSWFCDRSLTESNRKELIKSLSKPLP